MTAAQLGQHFLVSRAIAEKIVKAFLPVKGSIVEIGPGKGILSELLVKYCPGCRITLVELDPSLANELQARYPEPVRVLEQDILRLDLSRVFMDEVEPVRIIGNVPYYISKELIDWLLAQWEKVAGGVLMMQKEFVDKLLMKGRARETNAQAMMFSGLFKSEKVCEVQPGSFSPPPKVKSVVFRFERRGPGFEEGIEPRDFYKFLKACFVKRRKTLLNNLGSLYDAGLVMGTLDDLGIDTKVRAEQLSLESFMRLYRHMLGRI